MLSLALVILGLASQGLAQSSFKCPDEYLGFYPHATSCDKYWKCEEGKSRLKTCGNGLAFDDSDPEYTTENCDYLYNVQCQERTELEPPIATPNCPRLFGVFPDENNCNTFWSCWNGESNKYQCPPGLAYDRTNRVCMWSDAVPECRSDEIAGGFTCPATKDTLGFGAHTRHAHLEDCRKFYVCISGSPREYGCPLGQVYQIGDADGFGNCAHPEDVPGCEDYYGDLDLDLLEQSNQFGQGSSARRPSHKTKEE